MKKEEIEELAETLFVESRVGLQATVHSRLTKAILQAEERGRQEWDEERKLIVQELIYAATEANKWVRKGVADGHFTECIAPNYADACATRLEIAIEKAELIAKVSYEEAPDLESSGIAAPPDRVQAAQDDAIADALLNADEEDRG